MSGDISNEEILRKVMRDVLSRTSPGPEFWRLNPADEADTLAAESDDERLEAEALSADLDRRLADALAKSEELLRSLDQRFGN
jgi:hypothetical protein